MIRSKEVGETVSEKGRVQGVKILRQHYQYEMLSSRAYRTTVISVIKYDNTKKCLFMIPVHGIVEDMEVRDSTGSLLPVLTAKEAMDAFDIDIQGRKSAASSHYESSLELIPVALDASNSEYARITMTYTTYIGPTRFNNKTPSPNMKIDFPFKIVPGEFIVNNDFIGPKGEHVKIDRRPFNVHILFKAGDDYKINRRKISDKKRQDDPSSTMMKISIYPENEYPRDSPNYGKSRLEPTEQDAEDAAGFYVRDLTFDEVVVGSVDVGLADSLQNTTASISAIAFFIPVALLVAHIGATEPLDSTLEILGISAALLIGERVWVLKDRYLMTRWRKIHFFLLILNGFAFALWLTLWSSYWPIAD